MSSLSETLKPQVRDPKSAPSAFDVLKDHCFRDPRPKAYPQPHPPSFASGVDPVQFTFPVRFHCDAFPERTSDGCWVCGAPAAAVFGTKLAALPACNTHRPRCPA